MYAWHFKLADVGEPAEDALAEMVTEQLRALLRCVTLLNEGQVVRVTGFRFLNEREGQHDIRPDAPDGLAS